jgi:acyl-coenzyme A thioesterase PaaI-like protein
MKEFKAEAGNVAECQCESYGEADKVKARMEKDALAKHLGIRLLEMKPGYAGRLWR